MAANYRIIVLLIASLSLATSAQTTSSAGAPPPSPTNDQHPVALDPNASSTTCLKCHSNLQKGQYVHTAMSMGCTTCHTVDTENGTTRVKLTAPIDQMCVTCHMLSTTEKVLHGPYHEGLCVACHSPHASDFPAHLWASAQDICLGCHTRSRLKVDEAKQTVTTPWGQTLTFAQMKGSPYLNLNATETLNHPVDGHPVSGPNTVPQLGSLTCLSCHRPHGSNYANLLPVGPLASMPDCKTCGLCKQCHANMY